MRKFLLLSFVILMVSTSGVQAVKSPSIPSPTPVDGFRLLVTISPKDPSGIIHANVSNGWIIYKGRSYQLRYPFQRGNSVEYRLQIQDPWEAGQAIGYWNLRGSITIGYNTWGYLEAGTQLLPNIQIPGIVIEVEPGY